MPKNLNKNDLNPLTDKKYISVFTLVMITVIAVDSLRSIPLSAQYGFSLVFYYLLAAVVFLIPSALVSAELSSSLPKTGGLYIWIREAFGDSWASFVIWLQWIYNICWYPTILALLAASLAYPFMPHLADNKFYMLFTILGVYWFTTWINLQGINASANLSRFCAILGTLIPMITIVVIASCWLKQGNKPVIEFSWNTFIPEIDSSDNWIFLSSILYSLLGIEISAYHAQDVKNPQKNFPKALFISATIILFSIIFASLAVAIVIPEETLKVTLISGMLDAFKIFFTMLDLDFLFPVMCILIVIGTLGGVGAWLIGPSKGLLIAAQDGHLPKFLAQKNSKGAPQNILITQGLIFSLLSTAYIFMPNVNSAFFILSILTAQLALFGYIFMFLAVIKLRHSMPHLPRPFKIPGGKPGLYIVSGLGIASCSTAILLSFLPPDQIPVGNYLNYELMLVGSFLLFILAIFKLSRTTRKKF